MTPFHRAAGVDDVPPGRDRVVEVQGRPIALFHHAQQGWFALDNTCRHQGGPLGEGAVEGTTVTCPWHGWRYDLASGRVLGQVAVGVRRYPVRVEGRDVLVEV